MIILPAEAVHAKRRRLFREESAYLYRLYNP